MRGCSAPFSNPASMRDVCKRSATRCCAGRMCSPAWWVAWHPPQDVVGGVYGPVVLHRPLCAGLCAPAFVRRPLCTGHCAPAFVHRPYVQLSLLPLIFLLGGPLSFCPPCGYSNRAGERLLLRVVPILLRWLPKAGKGAAAAIICRPGNTQQHAAGRPRPLHTTVYRVSFTAPY